MSQTVISCAQCGEKNSPTRLHCKSCGAKLDLSAVKFKSGSGGGIKRILHGLVFLSMLSVLGLLVWSPPAGGAIGSEEEGYVAYQNMLQLYEAIQAGQSLHRDFSEEEMNAYLAVRVDDSVEGTSGRQWKLALESINVSFTEGQVTVHIGTRWQFLALAYTLTGEPLVERRGVQLRLERVALGRLPIPGPFRETFAMRMMPILDAMQHDRIVLNNVTRIGMRSGQCRLMVSPE